MSFPRYISTCKRKGYKETQEDPVILAKEIYVPRVTRSQSILSTMTCANLLNS